MDLQLDLHTIAGLILVISAKVGWDISNMRAETERIASSLESIKKELQRHLGDIRNNVANIDSAAWKNEETLKGKAERRQ